MDGGGPILGAGLGAGVAGTRRVLDGDLVGEGRRVGLPGGVKLSSVPESFFISLGSGVLTLRPETAFDGVLLGALIDLVLTGIFGTMSACSSFFHSPIRWAMASALATRCLPGSVVVVGVEDVAPFACAAARRAADLVVRTTGCDFTVGFAAVAGAAPRDVDAAVPGREVGREPKGPGWVVEAVVAALRSLARSRGESVCEATVSRTFAEPTIIDFGRGLRAAVLSGLLDTACVLLSSFDLAGPIIEIGLAVFFLPFSSSVLGTTILVAITVGEIGVDGLLARFSKASAPSDRFSDSCILCMSSCMDERK